MICTNAFLMFLVARATLTREPKMRLQTTERRVRHLSSYCYLESNVISSSKSKTIARIASLRKRKKRLEFGQTVAEGPRIVLDLVRNSQTRHLVEEILISTDKWDEMHSSLGDFLSAEDFNPRLIPTTPNALKACSDTVTPQGILAVTRIPEAKPSSASLKLHPNSNLFLVLDGVSDPGNVGTLLRSGLATGVAGVFLLPGSCDPWSPKAIRSGMGATYQLPLLHSCKSWEECRNMLLHDWKCTEETVWAATMLDDVEGTAHFDVPWATATASEVAVEQPVNHAVIIGSEGQGLSESVRNEMKRTGQTVYVPMQAGIESLNAGVCGSVILFEFMRQRDLSTRTTDLH